MGLLDFVFDYTISGAGELFTYVIKRVGWFWGDGGGPQNATDVGPQSATCAPLRLLTPEYELSAAQHSAAVADSLNMLCSLDPDCHYILLSGVKKKKNTIYIMDEQCLLSDAFLSGWDGPSGLV